MNEQLYNDIDSAVTTICRANDTPSKFSNGVASVFYDGVRIANGNWHDDYGVPWVFNTVAEAQAAIDDLLQEMPDYDVEDYRIEMIFFVTLNYATHAGNICAWAGSITAPDSKTALDLAIKRIQRRKYVARIFRGDAA